MTATALLCLLLVEPADLIRQLRSDDAAVRLRAVQQVERLGADGSPDEVYLAPLAKLLSDPSPQTRGLAALALSRHVVASKEKVPDGVVIPLLGGLREENVHFAAYCGRTLTVLGERALPDIRAVLASDQLRGQRQAALEGCRRLASIPACRQPVEAILWPLLADRDVRVRDRAYVLLRSLRADYPLPPFRDPVPLTAALRLNDARIRTLAAAQLIALEEEAFPLLLNLLGDPSRSARTESARVLATLLERGLIPNEELTPILQERSKAVDIPEATEVRAALDRIAREQAPPSGKVIAQVDKALALMVSLDTFDNSPVYQLIAPIENEAVKVLVERLRSDDPKIQAAAAVALRPIFMGPRITPSSKALANLGFALRSRRIETAQEAAQTLRYALKPTRKAPPTLLDALRNALSVESVVLRVRCSFALASCGAQAEETLIVLLQDRNIEVQFHASEAVAIMAENHWDAVPGTAPYLKRLCVSSDAAVRRSALGALDALQRLSPGDPQ
jgi:HEAT repeat protein